MATAEALDLRVLYEQVHARRCADEALDFAGRIDTLN
jgi:hypothetical protein